MTIRSAKFSLSLGLPAAIVIVMAPWFLFALPEPVASHFDLGGQPNGSASQTRFLIEVGGLAAFGIALCLATVLLSRKMAPPFAALMAMMGGFLGGLGASILAVTALTQRGIATWTDASSPGFWIAGVIAVAAVFGVIGARAGSRLPQAEGGLATKGRPAATALTLGEGERAVWAATQDAPWVLVVSLGMAAVGVAGALILAWPFVFLAVVGVAISALANVHVRADQTGLHVRYGFLRWPRTNIALERIEQVSVLDVRPLDWGGWGYRGSLNVMDQAAVIHRAGPGLRLDLVDGKIFVITIDDPDGAAAVLAAVKGQDLQATQ